jgi:hypothetical protein
MKKYETPTIQKIIDCNNEEIALHKEELERIKLELYDIQEQRAMYQGLIIKKNCENIKLYLIQIWFNIKAQLMKWNKKN